MRQPHSLNYLITIDVPLSNLVSHRPARCNAAKHWRKHGRRIHDFDLQWLLPKIPGPRLHMGLYFNGEARDTCWGRGMFRGSVSGSVSGYVSGVCFGYVSRHQELLYLQFRGYVTGYVSGVCFGVCFAGCSRVCNPCAILKPEPPKKTQTHIVSGTICPVRNWDHENARSPLGHLLLANVRVMRIPMEGYCILTY